MTGTHLFGYVIQILLPQSAVTFTTYNFILQHFSPKKGTSQVPIDNFPVSIGHLREVSVLYTVASLATTKMTEKLQGPRPGVCLIQVSIL